MVSNLPRKVIASDGVDGTVDLRPLEIPKECKVFADRYPDSGLPKTEVTGFNDDLTDGTTESHTIDLSRYRLRK